MVSITVTIVIAWWDSIVKNYSTVKMVHEENIHLALVLRNHIKYEPLLIPLSMGSFKEEHYYSYSRRWTLHRILAHICKGYEIKNIRIKKKLTQALKGFRRESSLEEEVA